MKLIRLLSSDLCCKLSCFDFLKVQSIFVWQAKLNGNLDDLFHVLVFKFFGFVFMEL
uniref:Uncharacterized protein n=1 Tax=Rhizophora mucronata TaxID=61149 RepID=A0A2P2QLE8_RHIMU